MNPPFAYRDWARYGIGSRADFNGEPGGELNFTLVALDAGKVVLEVDEDRSGATTRLGAPLRMVVSQSLPDAPRAQGKEILQMDGEDRLCTWTEGERRDGERTVVVKSWACDDVPGGLLRWSETTLGATQAVVWTLRSFARPT